MYDSFSAEHRRASAQKKIEAPLGKRGQEKGEEPLGFPLTLCAVKRWRGAVRLPSPPRTVSAVVPETFFQGPKTGPCPYYREGPHPHSVTLGAFVISVPPAPSATFWCFDCCSVHFLAQPPPGPERLAGAVAAAAAGAAALPPPMAAKRLWAAAWRHWRASMPSALPPRWTGR